MFKLVLEKAEEQEIKLTISVESSKKQEFQKNMYFYFIEYAKAFDCVDHNKLWEILKEMVKAQHEGALPPPCIVRKDPRVPHTARRGA